MLNSNSSVFTINPWSYDPRFTPILSKADQALDDLSFEIDPDEANPPEDGPKKAPSKCRFCQQLKKTGACVCIKNFPKQAAKDILNYLPNTRNVRNQLRGYLDELAKKPRPTVAESTS